jgi:maltooligosyltrehalose trehalohydrolase
MLTDTAIPMAGRRLPIGAEVLQAGGAHFRVWAPRRWRVEVALERPRGDRPQLIPLDAEGNGYFSTFVASAAAGDLYRYRLDGEETLYPDPASRFQPDGPEGPSMIVDPAGFQWTDTDWRGASIDGQVLYEMHLGTFTPEGSWSSATQQLAKLAELGITVIEVMPIADFPGRFGWGYDGVNLFAPTRLYGRPDDLRSFVDTAHSLGIAIILDVVYNHFGPAGNYLEKFTPAYFTDRYENEWGAAIDFDGPNAGPVREFFLANAGYWIDEYHLDGLRLDATQQIFDASDDHIVAAIARRVRSAAGSRRTIVLAENEPQDVRLLRPETLDGFGLDALWNDDFHHAAVVALTGRREAYYTDYMGRPQEFISMAKRGFLYQGQLYSWQRGRRGTASTGFPRSAFVVFLENHDQVANSASGARLRQLTSPGRYRAITALFLLAPGTPMLFQGQEFGSSRPFLYFADHEQAVAETIREGRASFLRQFPSIADPEVQRRLADPSEWTTYERSKLDPAERDAHPEIVALHRDLMKLRREDPVLARGGADGIDGAVLTDSALVLRFFSPEGDDRLLVHNLGTGVHLSIVPEPLLAPPAGREWRTIWSSENPRYGGCGVAAVEREDGWYLTGESAAVLAPVGRTIGQSSGQEGAGD